MRVFEQLQQLRELGLEEMRLRLARVCRAGDVFAEHAAFCRQRPEFFNAVNRGATVTLTMFNNTQLC